MRTGSSPVGGTNNNNTIGNKNDLVANHNKQQYDKK